MGQSYSQQNLKVNSKMSSQRLAMLQRKKANVIQVMRRELAESLATDKVDMAKIRVEGLLKEKDMVLAAELLQQHCDRLFQRVAQISAQSKCPDDVFQSVATIIYCSTRMPVPEFKEIAKQFALKYSKEWVMPLTVREQYADKKVLKLIDVLPPSNRRIQAELVDIATEFDIEYVPEEPEAKEESDEEPAKRSKKTKKPNKADDSFDDDDDEPPTPPNGGVGAPPPYHSDAEMAADLTAVPNSLFPRVPDEEEEAKRASTKQGKGSKSRSEPTDDEDDVDDLEARFAALKKL